jgi:hypothetical protein
MQDIISKDVICFSAGSGTTQEFGAPNSKKSNSKPYGQITICLKPLENLPASDAPPVGNPSDGILVHIDPLPFSSLPPSDEIAISSEMELARSTAYRMANPRGLSTCGNAVDIVNKVTTSESFSIVFNSVEKLVKAADLLSEVSLTSTCIENDSFYCHLIGTNSNIVRFIRMPKSL